MRAMHSKSILAVGLMALHLSMNNLNTTAHPTNKDHPIFSRDTADVDVLTVADIRRLLNSGRPHMIGAVLSVGVVVIVEGVGLGMTMESLVGGDAVLIRKTNTHPRRKTAATRNLHLLATILIHQQLRFGPKRSPKRPTRTLRVTKL